MVVQTTLEPLPMFHFHLCGCWSDQWRCWQDLDRFRRGRGGTSLLRCRARWWYLFHRTHQHQIRAPGRGFFLWVTVLGPKRIVWESGMQVTVNRIVFIILTLIPPCNKSVPFKPLRWPDFAHQEHMTSQYFPLLLAALCWGRGHQRGPAPGVRSRSHYHGTSLCWAGDQRKGDAQRSQWRVLCLVPW